MKNTAIKFVIVAFGFAVGTVFVWGYGGNVKGTRSSNENGVASGDLGGSFPSPTVLSVANVTTGVLPVANGGTAGNTAAAARTALGAANIAGDTFTGQFIPLVRTKAQINALVPRGVGALIICSDCTIPYSVCTAPGTLAAQFARAGPASVGCGSNN